MKATSKQRKSNADRSRLSWMAKVRDRHARMTTIFTLANSALAFADANYQKHPQSAAVRLAATMREIAAQLPADAVNKEARCRSKSTR